MVSSMTSEKRLYTRVTFGSLGTILTTLKGVLFLPKKSSAVCIIALETQL